MKDLVSNIGIVSTFKSWIQTDSVTHRPKLELAVTGALCLESFGLVSVFDQMNMMN